VKPAALRKETTWDAIAVPAIDILWMTAGLGCDGDTIAVTAATQPSIEDLILGTFPFLPTKTEMISSAIFAMRQTASYRHLFW